MMHIHLAFLVKQGYQRAIIDDELVDLSVPPALDKNKKHNIELIVDRLVVKEGIEKRLADSLETAIKLADGLVSIQVVGGESTLYSTKYSCPDCGISIEEFEPRLFSFNNPFGACPECSGLGYKNRIDPALIVKNPELSLREGAMTVTGWNLDSGKMAEMNFKSLAEHYGFSLDTPVKDLPKEIYQMLLYGNDGEKIKMNYTSI